MKIGLKIVLFSACAVLIAIAFVVVYKMGKNSYVKDDDYYEYYISKKMREDLGEPMYHFDYKNSTRTICYTKGKTCYVDTLDIIK